MFDIAIYQQLASDSTFHLVKAVSVPFNTTLYNTSLLKFVHQTVEYIVHRVNVWGMLFGMQM